MSDKYFGDEDGEEYLHRTKEGDEIRLQDMSDSHLLNAIRFIERKAKSGDVYIDVNNWTDFAGAFADVYYLDEKEALAHFNHHFYVEEARSRGLTLLTH